MWSQNSIEKTEHHAILRPLSRETKSRRFNFAVYDIETLGKDSLEFHNCGFFDGETYTNFLSMEDFLCHCLRKQYNGWRFFAHFGGRFDVHFVFDWLRKMNPSLMMEINCSGSSVISLTIREGKNRWRFVDSYRLMPKSLATLTNDFDVQHKKLKGLDFTDELYNEHDCRGLYEVLEIFFDQFDICSETIASHAMRVFRQEFLSREIWQPNRETEDFIRRSYYGGRCEIFRYDRREVNHFDVNSLFPSAMCEPVPVEYLFESRELCDSQNRIGFYHASIDYPETYLPVLPFRAEKLYFPIGEFEGVFTSMELQKAINDGARVKIFRGKVFKAEPILRDYAESLFELKRQAEIDGKNGLRYITKILLNSLYGKFGQRREQRSFIVDDGRAGVYPLPNGLAWYLTESHAAHILPHISSTITARARLIQHDLLSQAKNWYTDTDSLFTTAVYPCDDKLGALHYEGKGVFQAYRLKEYFFNEEYKIKGLPRSRNDDAEKRKEEDRILAELYLAGEEIFSERMAGWAESIRAGLKTVRRVERPRHRLIVRDKRARIGDDTRPWNVKELLAA
jgi:hypothetical protein